MRFMCDEMLGRLPDWCKRLMSVALGVVGIGAAVLIASWYLRPSQSQAATERRSQSANREIGTQASVVTVRRPGYAAMPAK